jgi:hypothetical protein
MRREHPQVPPHVRNAALILILEACRMVQSFGIGPFYIQNQSADHCSADDVATWVAMLVTWVAMRPHGTQQGAAKFFCKNGGGEPILCAP